MALPFIFHEIQFAFAIDDDDRSGAVFLADRRIFWVLEFGSGQPSASHAISIHKQHDLTGAKNLAARRLCSPVQTSRVAGPSPDTTQRRQDRKNIAISIRSAKQKGEMNTFGRIH